MVTLPLAGGRLRPWSPADADQLVAAWRDPDISRWNQVPPRPTKEVAERWINGWQERFDRRLSVDLVIEADEVTDVVEVIEATEVIEDDHAPVHGTARVVGEIGLSHFTKIGEANAHDRVGALVGYWLLPEGRGRGLAFEALRAVTAWAFSGYGVSVVVARCHPENDPSHRVAARAGFEQRSIDGEGNLLWFGTTGQRG